jgi:hypothetical protein
MGWINRDYRDFHSDGVSLNITPMKIPFSWYTSRMNQPGLPGIVDKAGRCIARRAVPDWQNI